MTTLDTTRRADGRMGHTAGLTHAFFSAFADWRAKKVTKDALLKLSDRELNDIGLDRWDVENLTARDLR